MTLADIEVELEMQAGAAGAPDTDRLLALAERALECWLEAHGNMPTSARREGFRLLALHRQGARGDPSFNACRESCREIAYRYNLAHAAHDDVSVRLHLATLQRLVQHLTLFISGKLQSARLGEFCCSSRALRQTDA